MLMLPDFRVRQRDFLLEISRAITAQLDLGEVLRQVLNASVVMLSGQVGLIALRGTDDLYTIRATVGIDNEQIPRLNRELHSLFRSADDAQVASDYINVKLRQIAVSIDRQLRQFIALPLIVAEKPLGVIIIFRNYTGTATPNDLQVLQSFADQAAIAVHNAQLYEQVLHERKSLAAILDYSGDGVMILDANLHIERFNQALERITACFAGEAIGRHQDEIFVWNRLEKGDLQQALDNGWPFKNEDGSQANTLYVEGDIQRRDGLRLSIGITYAPLFTASGELASVIANVRDITNFRKAQEMQNTFISVVSHELKTPVAIIKGYAATLRRPDANWDSGTIQQYLAVIEDEADRLDELIQNLLTASRIQTERAVSLTLGDVLLPDLIQRAVERFRQQTNKHRLLLELPVNFPVIQGDETRLRQVLDNLISNAIKYSPDGGDIQVGGKVGAHDITIYVRDHGVGLNEQDRQRVFDRFFRVDGTLSRKTQGTGLGLYLSRAIIEAHKGFIGVESKPGQGSTFYFTLPIT